jgi:predicted nucleotidyltransferase
VAKHSPTLPIGPLQDLTRWWRATKTKGMIIGGLAVAFRGKPRATIDVDAIVFVDESRWDAFLDKGKRWSFNSRVPDALEFAKENRIFILTHEKSNTKVDLAIGNTEFEREAIQRAGRVKYLGASFPVASAEDLVILKAIAQRSIDDVDIFTVFEMNPNLDIKLIRNQLKHFAEHLDMPEILDHFEELATKVRKAKQRKKR